MRPRIEHPRELDDRDRRGLTALPFAQGRCLLCGAVVYWHDTTHDCPVERERVETEWVAARRAAQDRADLAAIEQLGVELRRDRDALIANLARRRVLVRRLRWTTLYIVVFALGVWMGIW